jgi:glyoxylate reductase
MTKSEQILSSMPRVMAPAVLNPTIENLLSGKVELVPWGEFDSTTQGCYCYGHRTVDAAFMDRCPNLRVISNHGVGVDHIDVAAARARSIPVGNTPRVLDGAVADMAFALLLAAARRLVEGDRFARLPTSTNFGINDRHGRDIHGATLGIVGMGNIGLEIAKRAHGFDMRVLYCNRKRRDDIEDDFASYVTLDHLLEASDFVILMVPLTNETFHLIGPSQLDRMKPTATLINIARGPVVDTDALTQALINKKLWAAALDVTDPEPLPRDHRLLGLENVIISPHLGSATVQTRQKMAELSVANLLAGLEGRPLICRVT